MFGPNYERMWYESHIKHEQMLISGNNLHFTSQFYVVMLLDRNTNSKRHFI